MTVTETSRRKVLIVSFYFPPTNAIAAVRLGKFAKYLGEFGWDTVVLTADTAKEYPQTLPVETDETHIFRTGYSALGSTVSGRLSGGQRRSSQGSPRVSAWRRVLYKLLRALGPVYTLPLVRTLVLEPLGWYGPAVRKGLEILSREKIDIIFSSYGPAVSHLVASRLHEKTGVPWVGEFRDLWSLNHNLRRTQPFHFFEKRVEKRVMKGSAEMIAVSEPAARRLGELHSKEVATVHNGFDVEDYVAEVPLTTRFTITYTGYIYPGKQDLSSLFRALAQMKQEGGLSPDQLEVRFFGANAVATVAPLVERHGVGDLVEVHGLVPFRESIYRQKESTALLLLLWNDPAEKGAYSAKVFEYLGAGRPILAVGPRGDVVDDLLRETGAGVVATDAAEIEGILRQWMQEYRESGRIVSHFQPDNTAIARYTRRQQTAKLAQVFEEMLARKRVP